MKQDIVCHVLASSTSLSLHLHYYPPPHYYVHQHYRDPYNCFFLPVLLLLVLVISIIITNSLVLSPNIIFSVVPSGSSSRGGAVTVYVLDINQQSSLTLFIRSCVCFYLYGPFNCISFHKFSRQLSAFSLCSSGLTSALLVLSTTYLFMKVSFSPDIILCR